VDDPVNDRKEQPPQREAPGPRPGFPVPGQPDRVQCPNCCRFARVINEDADLLFYECELCGSVGATLRFFRTALPLL
jgi:hypothetical protein